MDIRAQKTLLLESLDLTEVTHKAVSLAIDCIIENHINYDEIPLVITSYDDSCRQQVLNATQKFCEVAYPNTDKIYFNPCVLRINGRTSEEACINLIKILRISPGILFWADTPSWFANLPDGLFHVVSIDRNTATRGFNKRNAK